MNIIPWIAILLFSVNLHAQTDDSTQTKTGDRRNDLSHAVMMELAWNGLGGGLGFHYSHYLPETPHVVDLAFGLGATGAKMGARYRHLLVPHKRTSPFLGIGLNYASGLGDEELDVTDGNDDTLYVRVKKSANLLLNLGLDFKAGNGFVFVPSIGWAFDLMDDDYEVVSGMENRNHRQALRLILKGGFQLSFITGWSF